MVLNEVPHVVQCEHLVKVNEIGREDSPAQMREVEPPKSIVEDGLNRAPNVGKVLLEMGLKTFQLQN